MNRLTPLLIIGILIPSLLADTWHSSDGRTIDATGIAWNRIGVILKRDDNQKALEIPFGNISPDDVKRALQSLPFRTNDDVRVSATTMVVSSSAQERDTGDYVANVQIYSYDGYNLNGTATISPITESYRTSGRVVEVELKSIRGDGHVGLEFYSVRGSGNDKAIYHSQCSVVEFRQLGSKARFSAPETENFNGWVVIVRSPNNGKIIDIQSSMSHLEKFVSGQLPEIAKINLNEAVLREEVLKSLKIPDNSAVTEKAAPKKVGD